MTAEFLVLVFYVTMSLVGLHTLFSLLKMYFLSHLFLIAAFLSSLTAVVSMTYFSGHLPVSGDFEKYQHIAMFMLLFSLLHYAFQRKYKPKISISGLLVFVFLLLILPGEKTVAENYIIYSKPDVVLFFQLRMLAIALFSYSLSLYFSALLQHRKNENFNTLKHMARNFLLLGAAAFLGGEFFGSVWALYGWGDPWRWSKGFFLAGALFLLSMIAVHIPAVYMKKKSLQVLFPSIPIVVIVVAYII
jgi:hypothetical protein